MRALIYLLTFSAVIASGFWAYRENYATQQALKDVSKLNIEIADLREALSIQRAEWAYLNRPDRLRDLATINFDRLGLLPMQPTQFGTAEQVAFPPPPVNNVVLGLTIEQPQSISGTLAAEGAQTP